MQPNEMILGIRSGKAERERVIRTLYNDRRLQNGVKKIIRLGGGSEDDFHEIFNYTLVQFMKGAMEKDKFSITSNVNSYLFGIARNLWLQELRKRNKLPDALPDDFVAVDNTTPIDLVLMNSEKKSWLAQAMERLGKNCKEVLMLWAANYKMAEIAKQLSYKSEGVVRKKKLLCMKELSKFVEAHPALKKILTE